MLNEIIHADCFDVMQSIDNDSIDLVLTDIPYLISSKQNFKNLKDYQTKSGDSKYNCMDFGKWDYEFDVKQYVRECYRILKPGSSIIIWSAWQQLHVIEEVFKTLVKGKDYGGRRIGIWEKTNPSVFNMQRMAIQPFEFFIWFRKGSNWTFRNQNDKYIDSKGVTRQLPERHYFKHGCIQGGHPTTKPVSIFEHLIKTYSNENEVVFDGCVGSGTTATACINTNRNFICVEIEEEWVKYARNEINNIEPVINF